MTLQIRNFIDKDLPTIVKLVNEDRKKAYEYTPYTEERLHTWIQEGKLRILMAEENGAILGSGAYYDGYWGEEIEWLIVPESPNRKHIEAILLEEAEKHVQKGTVFTVVDEGSPKITEWTERGYNPQGGLYHMVAALDAVKPLPEIPEGIVIRNLQDGEEERFVEAVNTGFGTERVKIGDIDRWKTESPPFDEEWIHVAEISGRIVSVVVAKPDTRYNNSFNGSRGYLGPAATLNEHRGKNLASALTRQAMNSLYEKGMNAVALYTSEQNAPSIALLRKLGFEVGRHWKFMRKNLGQPQQ